MACIGCGYEHDTIEEHLACESAEQERVMAEQAAALERMPKRDRRFTCRNAPIVKGRKRNEVKP